MSVADLTGTTWELKDALISYPTGGQSIYDRSFTVNITTSEPINNFIGDYASSFNSVSAGYDSGSEENRVDFYVSGEVYPYRIASGHDTKTLPDTWTSKRNVSFTITGGTDVTNSALISWLESNANNVTPAVPAVVISYDGNAIATIDASGTEVLETNGKMMADDITVEYTEPTLNLQSKTVSPAKTSQTITPDSGYDGLSSVWVNSMPLGLVKTPATTINTTPSISVSNSGLITATASATQNVTPTILLTGYVDSGEAGTITVSGSNTSQLTTQAATTYTPTTTDQTIASGKYLTGAQTILGDTNLTAGNIKKDVSIFNVTGTYEGGGGGGAAPTLSTTPGSGLSYFRNIADMYDSSYNRADVYATPTVGDTIYFETQGRWELSSLYEKDTGTPVPYTTISTASYGSKYSFVMPNVDVIFELYYND